MTGSISTVCFYVFIRTLIISDSHAGIHIETLNESCYILYLALLTLPLIYVYSSFYSASYRHVCVFMHF